MAGPLIQGHSAGRCAAPCGARGLRENDAMLSTTNHVAARLAAGRPPVLIVIVDTEEEFAWDRPFDRANVDTASVAAQPLMHERVFDRFYRVAGSDAAGSGLGLAIIKAIAERHGATLALDASTRLGGLKAVVTFKAPVATAV